MSVLEVVLLVGFSARLTRLVMVDEIGEPVRIGMIRLFRGHRYAVSLLGCPFCIGFWLSAIVLGSFAVMGHTAVWTLVAGAFTLNYVQAHLNVLLDLGDDR